MSKNHHDIIGVNIDVTQTVIIILYQNDADRYLDAKSIFESCEGNDFVLETFVSYLNRRNHVKFVLL